MTTTTQNPDVGDEADEGTIFDDTMLDLYMRAWAGRRGLFAGELQDSLDSSVQAVWARRFILLCVILAPVFIALRWFGKMDGRVSFMSVAGCVLVAIIFLAANRLSYAKGALFREFERDYANFHEVFGLVPDVLPFMKVPAHVEAKLTQFFAAYNIHRNTQYSDMHFGAFRRAYNLAKKFIEVKEMKAYGVTSQ